MQAVAQPGPQSVVADYTAGQRGQHYPSQVLVSQIVGLVDGKFGLDCASLVEFLLALSHNLRYEFLVGPQASNLNVLLDQFDQSLVDESLQKCSVLGGIAGLVVKFFLGLLLDPLDHVKTDLHLLHPALVDFSAFEYFFSHLDAVVHLLEDLLIPEVGLILDLVRLVLLLPLAILINFLLLILSVLVDELQKFTHPSLS